ncbi:MAG TPA: type II toxin-antitoxin system PemK/MazF family toxin [Candidatus Paceibacterota bacterium]
MQKDFDQWNEKKKSLHGSVFTDFVHTREVWWCAVGVNVGVEADGKRENFERPVLVIRKFSTEAVLMIPLTSRVKKDNPYHVIFSHEGREFSAVISQVRLISTKRLLRKMYQMDSSIFTRIISSIVTIIQKNRPPLA